VRQAIERIRTLRAEYRVPPHVRLAARVVARGADDPQAFSGERDTIIRLAHLGALTFDGEQRQVGAHATFGDGSEVFVALEGAIDLQQECQRLTAERARLHAQLTGLAAKLANPNFVARAPADVVARERTKEREWQVQRDVLDGKLKALGCS
jgi:valyl-tRNA synthetase